MSTITPAMLGIPGAGHGVREFLGGGAGGRGDIGVQTFQLSISPWYTVCEAMPSAMWLRKRLEGDEHTRDARFFDPDRQGSGWSGELDEDEQDKVQAAVDMLSSTTSHTFLGTLADAVTPLARNCDDSASLDAVFRRVRLRFSNRPWYARQSPVEDGSGVTVKEEDEEDLDWLDYNQNAPIFGLNTGINPFYRMLYGADTFLSIYSNPLTMGIAAPSSFVFPLNWSTATTLCARGVRVPVKLDPESRSRLAALSRTLHSTTSTMSDIFTAVQVAGVAGLLPSALCGPFARVFFVLSRTWLKRTGTNLLGSFADALERAAANGLDINDVCAHLLLGLYECHRTLTEQLSGLSDGLGKVADVLDFLTVLVADIRGSLQDAAASVEALSNSLTDDEGTFLLGLTSAELLGIIYRLPTNFWTFSADLPRYWTTTDTREPVIHLDPARLKYPLNKGSSTTFEGTWSDWDGYLNHDPQIFRGWLEMATPSLEFAYTLELASEILEQTFNQESLLCAVSALTGYDGFAGGFLRTVLADQGLDAVIEGLGGVSVSRLLRYLWRQTMVDQVLDAADSAGYDLRCLYEIFCWMRLEKSRSLLDAVLGSVDTFGVRDFEAGILGGIIYASSPRNAYNDLSSCDRAQIQELIALWDTWCLDDWVLREPESSEQVDEGDDVPPIEDLDVYEIPDDGRLGARLSSANHNGARGATVTTNLASLAASLARQGYTFDAVAQVSGWMVRRAP